LIVALDATALTLLVNPGAEPPRDPSTGVPVTEAKGRIDQFIGQVDARKGTVLIPTPALAETLVRAGEAGPAVLDRINRSARFRLADFDQRAAVELAQMTREAIQSGDKRSGSDSPWQKVKYDRQIIAIARVHNASAIYADDSGIATFASAIGLNVIRTWELPLPASEIDLFSSLNAAGAESEDGPQREGDPLAS
jgi:hypothetical protein